MITFDVSKNGHRLCRAGIEEPGVLTAILTWVVREPEHAPPDREFKLEVGGLKGDDHLSWARAEIQSGDIITIRIVDADSVDPPSALVTSNRALVEQEKRKYYEHLKKLYGDEAG